MGYGKIDEATNGLMSSQVKHDITWERLDNFVKDSEGNFYTYYIDKNTPYLDKENEYKFASMEVTMGQFRAALIKTGMKATVDQAVADSGNELLISDYEYRATVKRDWEDLIVMANTIGISDEQIDQVFYLAKTL